MTPVLVQQLAGYGAESNTFSSEFPPGAGNRLILFASYYAGSPPITDIPGWTKIGAIDDNDSLGYGYSIGVEAWHIRAVGDEWESFGEYTVPVDWSGASLIGCTCILTEWSDSARDVINGPVRTGAQLASALTLPSITPTEPGGVLLLIGMEGSGISDGVAPPDGMSVIASSFDYWLGMEELTTGATGTRTVEATPSAPTQSNIGLMFVLGPYVPQRIGGMLRTGPAELPIALQRTGPGEPIALDRTGPGEPITLERTGPDAPIVMARTEGEL